jgi:hypothetical protein
MKAGMATFAAEILPAVEVKGWSRMFVAEAEKMLDSADQYNAYSDIVKRGITGASVNNNGIWQVDYSDD